MSDESTHDASQDDNNQDTTADIIGAVSVVLLATCLMIYWVSQQSVSYTHLTLPTTPYV